MTSIAVNLCGSASATIPVTVTNLPPVAEAGLSQAVHVNAAAILNGSGSYDPDGHLPLAYGWTQTGGPYVALDGAAAVSATFIAPATPTVLTFTLVVVDAYGLASVPDATVVSVGDVPIAGLDAENSSPTTLGQLTIFTATITSGGNVAYEWDFGDDHKGAGQKVNHTCGAPDTYTAAVTATNAAGEVSAGQTNATTLVRVEEGMRPVFLPLVVKMVPQTSGAGSAVVVARRMQANAVASSARRRF